MSPIDYLNVALAYLGLVMAIFSIRATPRWRCFDSTLGDVLVLVAFLIMANANGLVSRPPVMAAFHLAVILNIIAHIRHNSGRRRRRIP